MSIDSQIKIAQINKSILKWLPRLDDVSVDVREKASEVLSLLALENPGLRDNLLPTLIRKAETETSWSVVCNSILFNISEIPSQDPGWVDPFLALYLILIKKPADIFGQYTIRDHAASYLWRLIEDGLLEKNHPDIPKAINLVRSNLKQGVGDRLPLMEIIDWYEEQ